jgi:hypothetical protein
MHLDRVGSLFGDGERIDRDDGSVFRESLIGV